MNEDKKEQIIKSTLTSKDTKEVSRQQNCENGKIKKVSQKNVLDMSLENWLNAERKYRGFYI
jgi:hypothetical protein